MSLEQTFAAIAVLRKERLRGMSAEGRWVMRRYEFEIRANGLGTWTASITDWKQVSGPGGGIGVGVHKDPDLAIIAAMRQLGLACG